MGIERARMTVMRMTLGAVNSNELNELWEFTMDSRVDPSERLDVLRPIVFASDTYWGADRAYEAILCELPEGDPRIEEFYQAKA